MHLKGIPIDEDRNLIPLIKKIGRAVKFEYLDGDGILIESEGIIREVKEFGVTISIHNPLLHVTPFELTSDDGLAKYYPFKGHESLVRIRDKEYKDGKFGDIHDVFINIIENIRPECNNILEA